MPQSGSIASKSRTALSLIPGGRLRYVGGRCDLAPHQNTPKWLKTRAGIFDRGFNGEWVVTSGLCIIHTLVMISLN